MTEELLTDTAQVRGVHLTIRIGYASVCCCQVQCQSAKILGMWFRNLALQNSKLTVCVASFTIQWKE